MRMMWGKHNTYLLSRYISHQGYHTNKDENTIMLLSPSYEEHYLQRSSLVDEHAVFADNSIVGYKDFRG